MLALVFVLVIVTRTRRLLGLIYTNPRRFENHYEYDDGYDCEYDYDCEHEHEREHDWNGRFSGEVPALG